jgi:serine/threonine protein kinase, bacterial
MLISSVVPKLPHHPDFRVVDVLAAADFGWEYLVEDGAGLWVLEELLPSAETIEDLPTLQAMLADRLQLFNAFDDAQVAASGEMLMIDDRLFWRREYVAGRSYRQLFDASVAQDETFTEDAVWDFLEDVLEPLARLHDRDLVHGAIELNAVVVRADDGSIVLQRSGGIREFGLAHHFYRLSPLLMVGPASLSSAAGDLQDLATIAVVLLTGDEAMAPSAPLLDELRQDAIIGDELATVLAKMLGLKSRQRLRDARAALAAFPLAIPVVAPQAPQTKLTMRDPIIAVLSIVFVSLVALALWRVANMLRMPESNSSASTPETTVGKFSGKTAPPIAPETTATAAPKPDSATANQSEKQGIPADLYDRLISEAATEKIPAQSINAIVNGLSEESRREVGTYYRRNYDRWLATLAARQISQPTVDILADTAFYLRVPTLRGQTLNPRSFGQLWYAIARDQITGLNQQQNLKVLTNGDFNESGKLANGHGRVWQVQVRSGEHLQLRLNTPKSDVRLSVIENEIVLIRDSSQPQWTAPKSSRSTTYEIILTPLKLDAVSYDLTLKR